MTSVTLYRVTEPCVLTLNLRFVSYKHVWMDRHTDRQTDRQISTVCIL